MATMIINVTQPITGDKGGYLSETEFAAEIRAAVFRLAENDWLVSVNECFRTNNEDNTDAIETWQIVLDVTDGTATAVVETALPDWLQEHATYS